MYQTLEEYNRRRNFGKTPEPKGLVRESAGELEFVIQKHAARRLHYDLRLELDGVLKSWAVTRGPSYNPRDRRLAMRTEDHPFDYGGFEGIIPKGEYGGGTVMIWDRGVWIPKGDPREGLAKGNLKFELSGERMKGGWALIRMKGGSGNEKESWLLIKEKDGNEIAGDDHGAFLEASGSSVYSGRTMEEIAKGAAAYPGSPASADPARVNAEKEMEELERQYPGVQLATLSGKAPAGEEWLHEIKFDGYRVMIFISGGVARIRTRGGHDWTDRFYTIAGAASGLRVDNAVIDAEAVVLDEEGISDFGKLREALGQGGNPGAIQAFCFDLLHLDGERMTRLPQRKRKAKLEEIIPKSGEYLKYSEHVAGGGETMIANACDLKLEGIICKRADAAYEMKRSRNWLKVKCSKRQDFVITGYNVASDRKDAIGALHIGYFQDGKLVYAGKVGTGFTARMAEDLFSMLQKIRREEPPFEKPRRKTDKAAVWVEPEYSGEVEFTEWTEDGNLRHPSFKGLSKANNILNPRTSSLESEGEKREKGGGKGDVVVLGVRITHPDRIVFPGDGVSKGDLAEYYALAAPLMLADIGGHPLSLVRCPEGLKSDCFYQRSPGRGMGKEVHPVAMDYKNTKNEYLMVDSVAGVLNLVQMGVIEMHPWGSGHERIDYPDRVVFDLDPADDVPFEAVKLAALDVRARLEGLGLVSFVKTTGGKGLHVVAPLSGNNAFGEVKAFAKTLAEKMQDDVPQAYIANMKKAKRKGKIFVDYMRNDYTATAIADFSVRARPGAGVAMPLEWEELDGLGGAGFYNIRNSPERLRSLPKDFNSRRHGSGQDIPKIV